jgi:phosphoglycerate dehydrogenase-like enzyme
VSPGDERSIRVLSTMRFDAAWLAEVAAADHRIEIVQHAADTTEELPPDLLASVEVLYTSSCLPSAQAAPRLRFVQLDTSGADHVVGTPLWPRDDVALASLGGISPRPMAGYVLAMILGSAYHLPALAAGQREREWPSPRDRWERYMPRRLDGATLAIVGYGRLGLAIGEAARAFGMRVVGVRRGSDRPGERVGEHEPPPDVEVLGRDRLHEVLARADYVVVTLPLTAETRNLLDRPAIAAMRPGAFLVNVSRGGIVDEAALLDALDDGRLGGVASDVFEEEPLPGTSRLWDHPRSIVTPHVAGFAPDYRQSVRDLFRENLSRYAQGRELLNLIDRRLGY